MKNVFLPERIVIDQSLSGDFVSPAQYIQYTDNICFHISATGTPTGIFGIQGSGNRIVDFQKNVISAGTWVDIPTSQSGAVSGAPNEIIFDLNQLSFPWVRVIYTRTSGTGTANIVVSGKAV